MDLKPIRDLLKSEAGRPLRVYLLSHYLKLNKISNLKKIDSAIDAAVDLKATQKAVELLNEMLAQIMSWSNEEVEKLEEDKLYNYE